MITAQNVSVRILTENISVTKQKLVWGHSSTPWDAPPAPATRRPGELPAGPARFLPCCGPA